MSKKNKLILLIFSTIIIIILSIILILNKNNKIEDKPNPNKNVVEIITIEDVLKDINENELNKYGASYIITNDLLSKYIIKQDENGYYIEFDNNKRSYIDIEDYNTNENFLYNLSLEYDKEGNYHLVDKKNGIKIEVVNGKDISNIKESDLKLPDNIDSIEDIKDIDLLIKSNETSLLIFKICNSCTTNIEEFKNLNTSVTLINNSKDKALDYVKTEHNIMKDLTNSYQKSIENILEYDENYKKYKYDYLNTLRNKFNNDVNHMRKNATEEDLHSLKKYKEIKSELDKKFVNIYFSLISKYNITNEAQIKGDIIEDTYNEFISLGYNINKSELEDFLVNKYKLHNYKFASNIFNLNNENDIEYIMFLSKNGKVVYTAIINNEEDKNVHLGVINRTIK